MASQSTEYTAALDDLEAALCERYHVASLDGLGVLGDAMAYARRGDLTALTAAMEGREMYRWGEPAEAALAAARVAAGAKADPAAKAEEEGDSPLPPPSSDVTTPEPEPASAPRRRRTN